MDYIFSQNYKVETVKSHLFPYKIWIAWAHITNPFYMEDCCFYSHISVMKNLSPNTDELMIGHQAQYHISWFLLLARTYNLYDNEKLYNEYKKMIGVFTLNKINRNILLKYRECINNQFIINTIKGGIQFHSYNNIDFYKKKSNDITDIINKTHNLNLKLIYNNKDFLDIDI